MSNKIEINIPSPNSAFKRPERPERPERPKWLRPLGQPDKKQKTEILPEGVKTVLDAYKDQLIITLAEWNKRPDCHMGVNVKRLVNVPYYIKSGIERVENAKRLRKVIQENNLNLLAVPSKYIYTINEGEVPSNLNSVVVCEEIQGLCGKGAFELTLEQTKQLFTLAIKAQHYGLHKANLVFVDSQPKGVFVDSEPKGILNSGKIFIIDTDKHEMPPIEVCKKLRLDYIKNGNYLHDGNGIYMNPDIINDPITRMELSQYTKHQSHTEEAYAWLSQKTKERENERLSLRKQLEMNSWDLSPAFLEF